MPTISVFYGIVIQMFINDHPPPRFHALYAGYRAKVSIETGLVIAGKLPPHASRLVRRWVEIHRAELAANWHRARIMLPLDPILPLP